MSDEEKSEQNQGSSSRQPVFLLPRMVIVLGGLMVLVQLAVAIVLNQEAEQQLVIWFGFLPVRLLLSGEIPGGLLPLLWTPVTHAFLHAGWDHLLVNVAWLAIFATPVMRRYGGGAGLVIFLIGAVAGAFAFAATTLPNVQVLIGASGGVAGLTGAAIRFIFQPVLTTTDPESGETVVLGRRLATLAELFRNPRSRFFILVWVVLNAAVPLLPALIGGGIQIAWQAHLGGFFAGMLLVPLFERQTRGESS